MTEQDWEDAMDLSRVRSERFPDYERKAVKVFKMVDEDDEPAILETVQEAIKNKKVDPFHRARLLMVVVAKIGMYSSVLLNHFFKINIYRLIIKKF